MLQFHIYKVIETISDGYIFIIYMWLIFCLSRLIFIMGFYLGIVNNLLKCNEVSKLSNLLTAEVFEFSKGEGLLGYSFFYLVSGSIHWLFSTIKSSWSASRYDNKLIISKTEHQNFLSTQEIVIINPLDFQKRIYLKFYNTQRNLPCFF